MSTCDHPIIQRLQDGIDWCCSRCGNTCQTPDCIGVPHQRVEKGDTDSPVWRRRALVLLCGDVKSRVAAAEGRTVADQSAAALADVVKLGWPLPCELREADFQRVRGGGGERWVDGKE